MRKHVEINAESEGRLWLPVELPFDYDLYLPASGTPRELIVLLHGYGESGKRMYEKLREAFPKDVAVLAPNGPFPVPFKKERGYGVVYSWYLYEPESQQYFIDMRVARAQLKTALERLKLAQLPKRLIGFSQGGYLAPIVACDLEHVKQVIGIGCEYLLDEFPGQITFRIDGIHGSEDEINALAPSRETFDRLKGAGIRGEFHVLEGIRHKVTPEVQAKVKELITAL